MKSRITILFLTISLLCLAQSHVLASDLNTNSSVLVKLSSSSFLFKEEKIIEFQVDPKETVLDVQWTNVSFLRHSLELHLYSTHSNTFSMRVKNYEITNFIFPSLIVTTTNNKESNTFYTPAFPLQMGTNFTNMQRPGPLMGIFIMRSWLWFWIAGGILFAGALLFVIFRFIVKKDSITNPKNIKDPYEYIVKTLRSMSLNTLSQAEYRNYCEMISEVTRRFLENTVKISAMEYSTKEIRASVSHLKMDDESQDIIKHILNLCDRVKYAKHEPQKDLTITLLNEAIALVFHISHFTRHIYSHNILKFQEQLAEMRQKLSDSTEQSLIKVSYKSLLMEYLYSFYFLEITLLDTNALYSGIQEYISPSVKNNLENIWNSLDDQEDLSGASINIVHKQIQVFLIDFARHFGYRPYDSVLKDNSANQEER